jgi:hypothetical protein
MVYLRGTKQWLPHKFIPEGWNNCYGVIPTFKTKDEAERYLYGTVFAHNQAVKAGTEKRHWWEENDEKEYLVEETLDFMRRLADDPDFHCFD